MGLNHFTIILNKLNNDYCHTKDKSTLYMQYSVSIQQTVYVKAGMQQRHSREVHFRRQFVENFENEPLIGHHPAGAVAFEDLPRRVLGRGTGQAGLRRLSEGILVILYFFC